MAPGSAPYNVTGVDEATYQRLKSEALREEERENGMRVVVVPDEVYAAERRKIARRRVKNKNARKQRHGR